MKPKSRPVLSLLPVMLWFCGFGLLAGWGLGLRQPVSLLLVLLDLPIAWVVFTLLVVFLPDLLFLKPGIGRAFTYASLFTLSMATVVFMREGFRPPIQLTSGEFPRGDLIWLDLRVLFGVGFLSFCALCLAGRSRSLADSGREAEADLG